MKTRFDRGAGRAVTAPVTRLAGALALALLAGCSGGSTDATTAGTSPSTPATSGPASSARPSPSASADEFHTTAPMNVDAIPVTLKLPNVKQPTPIEPAYTGTDNALIVPESGQELAYFIGSAYPGDPTGTAVIAGHKDTKETKGVFYHLADLKPGDKVSVETTGGQKVDYVVTSRKNYGKTASVGTLPDDLYSRKGAPRLAMVTCAGEWDPKIRAYPDNLVVYARPA